MGKGRQIGGIILDNYARGRRKSVWVSTSTDLYADATRDLRDLGSHIQARHGVAGDTAGSRAGMQPTGSQAGSRRRRLTRQPARRPVPLVAPACPARRSSRMRRRWTGPTALRRRAACSCEPCAAAAAMPRCCCVCLHGAAMCWNARAGRTPRPRELMDTAGTTPGCRRRPARAPASPSAARCLPPRPLQHLLHPHQQREGQVAAAAGGGLGGGGRL